MTQTTSSISVVHEDNRRRQRTTAYSKTEPYSLTNKTASLVSVDHHPIPILSDDTLNDNDPPRRTLNSSSTLGNTATMNDHPRITSHVRQCSITEMLLVYAQQDAEISPNRSDNTLQNIFNVLDLHFNMYANDKRQIYFEGIFQILHDFKEQITELVLIETMQLLQIDLLAPCTFENFILILCYLPAIKQDNHVFLDLFNALDHNKDSYITFEDIQRTLPYLTSHFDEEIIRAAIHIIDTDHDHDRLSYFDFVTSLIALQEWQLTIKTKASINRTLHGTAM